MFTHPLMPAEVADYLRSHRFFPYANWGFASRKQMDAGVRVLSLRAGEGFISANGGVHVTVLAGEVGLEGISDSLTPENTRQYPVLTNAGEMRLTALKDSAVVLADADFLDSLAAWEDLAQHVDQTDHVLAERMRLVKHSLAFRRLPLEQVEAALARMQSRRVNAGEDVVRQGDPGDVFYLVWSGKAEVWRQDLYDDEPQKVAELGVGDTFGDEALITDGTRNATVRMVENGELLALNRVDFLALMSQPMINETPPDVAQSMLNAGWRVVDVRYAEEYEDSHIPDAILLPLSDLRRLADDRLQANQSYVLVCRSGKRSAVAALLLSQRGYRVISMQGGMNAWTGPTSSLA